MTNNPQVLSEFLGYDERDLEFEKVVNDLDNHDMEYGIEVIFDY